jgi:hypothetical protein
VSRDRLEFWELGNFLLQRFGEDKWTCEDVAPVDGEKSAGTRFIKNHCEQNAGSMRLILEQHFFQKKGQLFIDPVTGKPQARAFESSTRFEMFDSNVPLELSRN